MIGRSLRQYVITAELGQGGMGQVWKARDTILEREVALKVLPPQRTDDPERKDRLFREAKSASALNHPNIVAIYEINSDQGIDFIAMEYIVGETLATLIHRRNAAPSMPRFGSRFRSQTASAVHIAPASSIAI